MGEKKYYDWCGIPGMWRQQRCDIFQTREHNNLLFNYKKKYIYSGLLTITWKIAIQKQCNSPSWAGNWPITRSMG
jgi:hypothetical protein